MGTPVPTSWPEIIADKWYCCFVHEYGEPPWDMGCEGPLTNELHGCIIGAAIQAWLDNGFECLNSANLIPGIPVAAQRLVNVHGPYDTAAACGAECF